MLQKDTWDFLFPVQALSKMFWAKFMSMLTSGLSQESVVIPQDVRKQCFEKAWVVYIRPPAKGVNQVLEYIGRYAYRVAISNSRIVDYGAETGMVTYDWKTYRHGAVHKQMRMHAVDFLHLFSLHVLAACLCAHPALWTAFAINRDKVRKVQVELG